ncbi:type II secretion system F family protein [Rhizobiales bacterium]|uniref:type II secretion system F family protein n=1 Tax=Hongsoonwoonella zoysiae TaxID=2821844 RepID=UPI00156009E5|nr:type II secretion system F family protein [Hongsoonwoonella zoysiae]NRG16130.1 type II secretion system F family protein [Hongsoonwoonella zoysiae]
MAELQAYLTPEVTAIAIALLVAFSIGGVLYALFQPRLNGQATRDKRIHEVAARHEINADRVKARDADRRRKNVQDQLKEFEERQKSRQKKESLDLELRIRQAGLSWSKRTFWLISLMVGLAAAFGGFFVKPSPLVVGAFGFVGFLGLPRWFVAWRRKRRFNAFLDELPNAVDVIVRGAKAGLPVNECIQIVAAEAREPVAGEFRRIVETQTMGVSLAEAVSRLPKRVPVAEANFFAIVIAIQQQAGGSLSEALGNLSKVLRGRKTLQGKIKAMSSEAKASAGIIGSLPILVMALLSLTSPDYIGILFTDPAGNLILAGGVVWMTMGVLVMRKMINFDH